MRVFVFSIMVCMVIVCCLENSFASGICVKNSLPGPIQITIEEQRYECGIRPGKTLCYELGSSDHTKYPVYMINYSLDCGRFGRIAGMFPETGTYIEVSEKDKQVTVTTKRI